MSALRISIPGALVLVDLGPGSASSGGVRGTFVVPERAPLTVGEQPRECNRRARMAADPAYAERRRAQRRAADARYREAGRAA